MSHSIFNQNNNNQLLEPMFLGNSVNVARYDQQRFKIFENLTEKQLSFFWRPEEIDVSKDRIDYNNLPPQEQHIFVSNLKYQILLDSVQGRSPSTVFLPLVSLPEVEVFITTWSFSEAIHSRSYTHIIRNIVTQPEVIFDDIMVNSKIIDRAKTLTKYYDELYEYALSYLKGETVDMRELKKRLYLCVLAVNILEGVRFYVSFACSFAFAENKKMEGNAKIIKMIARDEALHLNATQTMLTLWASGADDPEMLEIVKENEAMGYYLFNQAVEQEKEWAEYLFKDGSMIGLNYQILSKYIEYISNVRMSAIGLSPLYPNNSTNPIPWVQSWLSSDNVQVAPQETEITSYLVGQVDTELKDSDFSDFEL